MVNLPLKGKILCSNTDPRCENEAMKSFNIRRLPIDENLFNLSSLEFDKEHIDSSLLHLIMKMDSDSKQQLYDILREDMENNGELEDLGGL